MTAQLTINGQTIEVDTINADRRLSEAKVLGAIRHGFAVPEADQIDVDTLNYLIERGYVLWNKGTQTYSLAGWGRYDRSKRRYPEVMAAYKAAKQEAIVEKFTEELDTL